jgi:hypothetical protein
MMKLFTRIAMLCILLGTLLPAQDTASVVWPLTAAKSLFPVTAGHILAQNVRFHASGIASGMYLYTVTIGQCSVTKRMAVQI